MFELDKESQNLCSIITPLGKERDGNLGVSLIPQFSLILNEV
jgi:hypothetical protein